MAMFTDELNGININYTFETFSKGPSNEQVVAECQEFVYRNTYKNILLLYGELGCGKTHLLHAIVQEVKRSQVDEKIFYITGERLFCEIQTIINGNSLRTDVFAVLEEVFKDICLLAVDDFQDFLVRSAHFLLDPDKLSVEECWSFLLPKLVEENKRVVLFFNGKFDHVMKAYFFKKLQSKAELIEVIPPDYNTAYKILNDEMEKNESMGFIIEDAVLKCLASNYRENIRVLLGAFHKLIAVSLLENNKNINLNFAKRILKESVKTDDDIREKI